MRKRSLPCGWEMELLRHLKSMLGHELSVSVVSMTVEGS